MKLNKIFDIVISLIIAICLFISLKTFYLIWDYTDYGATYQDIYGNNIWLTMDKLQIYLLLIALILVVIKVFKKP